MTVVLVVNILMWITGTNFVCVFACLCLGMCMSKVVELPVKVILYLICLIKRDTNTLISFIRSVFRTFIRCVQFFFKKTKKCIWMYESNSII